MISKTEENSANNSIGGRLHKLFHFLHYVRSRFLSNSFLVVLALGALVVPGHAEVIALPRPAASTGGMEVGW